MLAALAEKIFYRIRAKPRARLADAAACRQIQRCKALGTDVQPPGHLLHRLVAEQGHTQHQPKHLIAGQPAPADGGLRGSSSALDTHSTGMFWVKVLRPEKLNRSPRSSSCCWMGTKNPMPEDWHRILIGSAA